MGCRLLSHFVIKIPSEKGIAEEWRPTWILASGCRGRYELRDGCRREILVEKAGEALAVERVGGGRELDGELGIGGGAEALVG